MKALFAPSVMLINKLRYPQKLTLIGAIFVIIVIALFYEISTQYIDKVRISRNELTGISVNQPLYDVLIEVQNFRTIKELFINNRATEEELRAAKVAVDNALMTANNKIDSISDKFNIQEKFNQIKNEWEIIKSSRDDVSIYGKKTEIITNIRKLIVKVCDNSTLTLDPSLGSYYLIDTYCSTIPNFREHIRQIQDLGTVAFINKSNSKTDPNYLYILGTLVIRDDLPTIKDNIDIAVGSNPELYFRFNTLTQTLITDTTNAMQILHQTLYLNNFDYSIEDYNLKLKHVLNLSDNLATVTATSIIELISTRINHLKKDLLINFIMVIVGLLVFIYLFMGVYFSIIQSIRQLVHGSDEIARGNLEYKVNLQTQDELSLVAESFNKMREMLLNIVLELHEVVTAVVHGNLKHRVDLTHKEGFALDLSSNINKLADIFQSLIRDITTVLDFLSKGNLTIRVTRKYQGVFSDIKNYVNETIDILEKLIKEIKLATDTIKNAAEEIALGNIDLEKRTEQQAASLEETSISMKKITNTVQKNSENAKGAHDLALTASEIALEGGSVVNKVVEMMNAINESARQITDITNVIDNIAFQTNILALNAAVEAARAGEQGRGFSVVATEIRNLAQRSSVSAQDIKALINSSVIQISEGKQLADEAGKTMSQVVNSVKNVTTIMSDIVNASIEQSYGLEQINIAISQMDQVTQKNSTLVEEAARSSQALKNQTDTMNTLVNIFKITDGLELPSKSPNIMESTFNHSKLDNTESHQNEGLSDSNRSSEKPDKAPDAEDEWSEF